MYWTSPPVEKARPDPVIATQRIVGDPHRGPWSAWSSRSRMSPANAFRRSGRCEPDPPEVPVPLDPDRIARSCSLHLYQRRNALTDPDAHRGEADPPTPRLSSWTSVVRMRAPEQPRGCPRAIAPPFTFTISGVQPQFLDAGDALRRERLVQLHQAHLVDAACPRAPVLCAWPAPAPAPCSAAPPPPRRSPGNAPCGAHRAARPHHAT